MTQHEGEHGARHVRLADLPKAEIGDHLWHPVRRALGATGFGVGAYSAVRAGDVLVGAHDEKGLGSNRHEELYVVLAGRALFELDGREVEVGPEEFLLVDPEVRRGARALADATSVLVIGGAPGAVAPAPYEHWYTALTTDDPHDAAEIAAGGLAQFPDHGQLNYQLACFRALAGELDVAARHLRRAVASDERAWYVARGRLRPGCAPLGARVPCRRGRGSARSTSSRRAPARTSCSCTRASRTGVCGTRSGSTGPPRRRVTRLDLRGFGRSDLPEGTYSHAGDVLAVLDALGIERAALVGASFGGRVALDLAASQPDRVPGLVLADAGLPDHAWSAEIQAFGAAEDEAIEAGDLDAAAEVNVDFWLPSASEPVRAAIREQQRNAFALQVGRDDEEVLLTDDLTARLGTVDVPTLVLVGERDYADFHAIADRLAAELPDTRRATISGAGHLPSLEQPEAFDAVVLPFLDSLA